MDSLPALPKRLDAPRGTPASIKFQVKSIVGFSKPTSVTVIGAGGEEITRTNNADSGSGFEFTEKSKGDIPIPSAEGFVRVVAKDAKDETVGVANVSIAEWLVIDNGSLVVPFGTAKESAKDDKAGKKDGPSFYKAFRDCKADSSANKGGYVVIRFQFGKSKEKDADAGEATPKATKEKKGKEDKSEKKEKKEKEEKADDEETVAQRSGRESVVPGGEGTPMGGKDAVVVRLRMAAASGLLSRDGAVSDAVLEVFGPRPEGGKKKSTAPRLVGGLDEKESNSLLNAKGLRATRTAPATIGKNSKGETKYSWRAGDVRSTAVMLLDPATDAGSMVRVHAYEKDGTKGSNFLGEATITVADLLASKPGNIKLKFEPRKDEPEARVKEAAGKLGQLLVDFSMAPVSRETGPYTPADGQFTHLRLQVTRCEGLSVADKASGSSDPIALVKAGGKQVLKAPEISNSLYPMWGGDGACLIPAGEAMEGVTVEVRDKDVVSSDFLGRAAFVPTGPSGSVLVPLADEKGAASTDASLGTVTLTWCFETLKEEAEEGSKTAASGKATPVNADLAPATPTSQSERTQSARRSATPSQRGASIPAKAAPEAVPESEAPARRQSSPSPAHSHVAVPAHHYPAPVERTPSARPAPAVADVSPAGLVTDFLRDTRPTQQDQYVTQSPYGAPSPSAAPNSGPSATSSPPKKVPITVPALLKIRGADMEVLESVPRANQIRFLQAVLRDIADHLMLDPVQLSIVNVGAGMLIDFKFQLTEDQARRNIMDAYVQKTLAGMLTMRYANAAYVDQLGGRPSHDPIRFPNIVAETAATFGEFRTAVESAPRLEIQPVMEAGPNRLIASPLATRGSPRMMPPPSSTSAYAPYPQQQQQQVLMGSPYGGVPRQPQYTESFQKPYTDQMVLSPNHRTYPPQQQQQQQYGSPVSRPPGPGPYQQRPPSPQQRGYSPGPHGAAHPQQQYGGGYPQSSQQRPPSPSAYANPHAQQQQPQYGRMPSAGAYVPQQQAMRQPIGGQYQYAAQQQGMPSSHFR